MVRPELLEILACPKCKDKVALDENGKYLVCAKCRVKYPVNEHGIPIMLIERAEPLDA
ncbi:MAG TPA: Trm112 family protein [Candidatus Krumholzibacteria bacterium]|nr:Trm112 family protein [Candidatus Krumholzibacteria bacterium]